MNLTLQMWISTLPLSCLNSLRGKATQQISTQTDTRQLISKGTSYYQEKIDKATGYQQREVKEKTLNEEETQRLSNFLYSKYTDITKEMKNALEENLKLSRNSKKGNIKGDSKKAGFGEKLTGLRIANDKDMYPSLIKTTIDSKYVIVRFVYKL